MPRSYNRCSGEAISAAFLVFSALPLPLRAGTGGASDEGIIMGILIGAALLFLVVALLIRLWNRQSAELEEEAAAGETAVTDGEIQPADDGVNSGESSTPV